MTRRNSANFWHAHACPELGGGGGWADRKRERENRKRQAGKEKMGGGGEAQKQTTGKNKRVRHKVGFNEGGTKQYFTEMEF
jgi:hypothetical protein